MANNRSHKRTLASNVAERLGISKTLAMKVCNEFLKEIVRATNETQRCEFRGFGSFYVTRRRAYTGRNPRTGEEIPVPARPVIRFRPSDEWTRKLDRTLLDQAVDRAINRAAGFGSRKRPKPTAV